MEASPLVNAHQASRSAFASAKDTGEAQQHHDEAAKQYAKAANSTDDSEALRILRLLEQQHKQLSTIVKSAAERPRLNDEDAISSKDGETKRKKDKHSDAASKAKEISRQSSPPTHRQSSREMRTSIASNLATARGIPSMQQRTSGLAESSIPEQQSARDSLRKNMASESQDQAARRKSSNNQAHVTDTPTSTQSASPSQASPQSPDHAFNKFYTSVEGIFSALSAPLAYAGLPLTQSSESRTPAATTSTSHTTPPNQPDSKAEPTTSTTPNLNKLFSRAALNAVKEDATHPIPIQDSFTIVPTSGGTMSYAKMLSHEERRARATLSRDDSANDDFVDAPEHNSRMLKRGASLKGPKSGKTFEELETENASLKGVINDYSKRLFMWQQSSQRQTQELQASVRLEKQRARGPGESRVVEKGREKVDAGRMKELEEKVKRLEGELESMGRENEKLKGVVARYRQRWEELRAGAKLRRDSPAGGEARN